MSFCGLRKPRPLRRRVQKEDKGKGKLVQHADEAHDPGRLDVSTWRNDSESLSDSKWLLRQKRSANFDWAREDQLSTILEQISNEGIDSRRGTPNWENEPNAREENAKWDPAPAPTFAPKFASQAFKKTRFVEHVDSIPEDRLPLMSFKSGGRQTPETPRSIAPPPTDVSSVFFRRGGGEG